MKKIKISALTLFLFIMGISQVHASEGGQRDSVLIITVFPGNGNPIPKAPVRIPTITMSGNTLHFDASCIGSTLSLFQGDTEVYTDIITDEDGIVVLPDDLTGLFELRLYRGGMVFVAEIEL